MKILLMPTDVSSKIAAGEVIDRPASVVKELIENSLDAGASAIYVDIRGGGKERIRVADDGIGIPAEEVELAFQRYATSKLYDAVELESVSTLGFRGEALPSIAAVSRILFVTRTSFEDSGTQIDVQDGQVLGIQSQGAAQGTVVTVTRLFENFPARKKFLRTSGTETSRIQTLITRYALAYPGKRFRLTVEGTEVFNTSGSGHLREAVADVYDTKVAQAMLDLSSKTVSGEKPSVMISGLLGTALVDRANQSHIALFVNGRWIQSRSLVYAIKQAYHGFLKERRFPIAVVSIVMPHEEIDVNIHPAKAEVKFRQEGLVFETLQQLVRQTLTLHTPVPELLVPHAIGRETMNESLGPLFLETNITTGLSHNMSHAFPKARQDVGPPIDEVQKIFVDQSFIPKKVLPMLRVLGQIHSTYIIAEGPDGIYLIDQHAAHEKVLFERVVAESMQSPPKIQSLLEPVTVELNPHQKELIDRQGDLIYRLGLHLERFGPSTFLIRGVPPTMPDGDPAKSLVEVLQLMMDGGGFNSWEERAAYSIACHGAIRAGKTLSQNEMSELLRQLEDCDRPHTCPHGRPTMIHMNFEYLEREFGRR